MKLLALAIAFLTAAPPAAAPDPAPELTALRKKLTGTASLSAVFTQTRRWAALKDTMVTRGTFRWTRGGKLVWHTNAPAESELVVEGKKATMSYPALGTTQSFDFSAEPGMGAVFESIAAVLQADFDKLAPFYEVAVTHKTPLTVSLKPRAAEMSKVIQGIELTFTPKLELAQVLLVEAGQDQTEISFRDQISSGG